MFARRRNENQGHAPKGPANHFHAVDGMVNETRRDMAGQGANRLPLRAEGVIDQAIASAEEAGEAIMKEVALLAEKIEPVMQDEDACLDRDTAYAMPVVPDERNSAAANRINALGHMLTEAARALEAMRGRVQL